MAVGDFFLYKRIILGEEYGLPWILVVRPLHHGGMSPPVVAIHRGVFRVMRGMKEATPWRGCGFGMWRFAELEFEA